MLKVTYGTDKIEVRFYHKMFAPYEVEGLTGQDVDEDRRGSLAIISLNGKWLSQGIAICHPIDNFCHATGRKVALRDALFSLSKRIRKAVWTEYKVQIGFKRMNTEHIIVSDNDGHNYIISADQLSEWSRWLDSEDCIAPIWCQSIGGAITLVKFKNFRIE